MEPLVPDPQAAAESLGRYRLIRRIAAGGMAEVFLAASKGAMGFEKTVVVKRIHPHLAEDARFVKMFFAEASLVARLNHPHIVQTFDFGFEDGHHFMAMEHVDGSTLYGLMAGARRTGERLSPEVCAKIISAVCEGLEYAHNLRDTNGEPLGLVHRDISPDNILVSRAGAVKVSDFGIAKLNGETHAGTSSGVMGKTSFISPEHVLSLELDRRADVFMVGVVLYWLLTGHKPFVGEDEFAVLSAVINDEPIPVRQHCPDVPPALEAVIERAMKKDRAERYASCREVYEALETFLIGSGKPVGTMQLAGLCQKLIAAESDAQKPAPRPGPATMTAPPRPGMAVAEGAASGEPVPATRFDRSSGNREAVRDNSSLAPFGNDYTRTTPARQNDDAPPTVIFADGQEPGRRPTPRPAPRATPGSLPKASGQRLAAGQNRSYLAAGAFAAVVLVGILVAVLSRPSAAPAPIRVNSSEARSEVAPAAPAPTPAPAATVAAHPKDDRRQEEPRRAAPEGEESASRAGTSHGFTGRSRTTQKGKLSAGPVPTRVAFKGEEKARDSEGLRSSVELRTNVRAQVRVDGVNLGWAPVKISDRNPGPMDVELFNPETRASKLVSLSLKPGKNAPVSVDIQKGILEFRIQPYATVFLDGERLGETPLDPVSLYEGRHVVKLVNPAAGKPVLLDVVITAEERSTVRHRF